MSKGSVHITLHEILQFQKFCAQWVPKHLSEKQKIHDMSVYMQQLMRYHEMGNHILSRIIAAEKTWHHHSDLATKSMGIEG